MSGLSRVYPLAGLLLGYALILGANPIRLAFRDGFRCIARYERVWLTFALLGVAYFIFQFATFTPIHSVAEIQLRQIGSVLRWHWSPLADVWQDAPLPTIESIAGIFDNASTTYPLSSAAALLLLVNWRGLHSALWRALRKLYGWWTIPIYLVVVVSLLAAIAKPVIYWKLPDSNNAVSTAHLLQISASIDALSFVFEYLVGVYIQVYLITVSLAWVKGLSFREGALFRFAMRRFSYVLEWAGVVVLVSMVVVRVPLLLAYFINIPDVLDYLPLQRVFMSAFILFFCSIQISLVLHNESLRAAMHAHWQLLRRDLHRIVWFFVVAGLTFFLLHLLDVVLRAATADQPIAVIIWKIIFVFARALMIGWLLASWVVLFRRCETGRVVQESWIRY